jgi:tetratricopeptide (TPR) repeat protein
VPGGLASETVEQLLWELEERALVYQARVAPEEYSFQHVLTQETVYQSLLPQRRAALHEEVARAIEALSGAGPDEYAEQLAYHYERSPDDEKAVTYLLKAGEKARRAYLNEEATGCFRRALARLEATNAVGRQVQAPLPVAARLGENLGDVLEVMDRHAEARSAYDRALAHVPPPDRLWRARLLRNSAGNAGSPQIAQSEERYEDAVQAYEKAEEALGPPPSGEEPEWWREWLEIQLCRMWLAYWRNQGDRMAELTAAIRPVVEQYGTPVQRSEFHYRAVLMALRRDLYVISDETLEQARAALAALRTVEDLGTKVMPHFGLGFCHLWRGELDAAEDYLQRAIDLAERVGDVVRQVLCLTYLTILSRKRGRVTETRQYALKSLREATAQQMPIYIGMAKAGLAWVAWREGSLAEAQKDGQTALELWRQSPIAHPLQWLALWPLIAVAHNRNERAEAVDWMRALLDPAQQPLPDALAAAVEDAIRAWDPGQREAIRTPLEQAIGLAQRHGYL